MTSPVTITPSTRGNGDTAISIVPSTQVEGRVALALVFPDRFRVVTLTASEARELVAAIVQITQPTGGTA